jgi:geranylgeranyl pyrophosphate synthase
MLNAKAQVLIQQKGQQAFQAARNIITKEGNSKSSIVEAANYFLDNWPDVQHPGLLALACEAVGGEASLTTQTGASLVLLSCAADIHDDLLDQSKTKYGKPTVCGKFGDATALLTGDFLLLKGITLLSEANENLSRSQSQRIKKLIMPAILEAVNAEIAETLLKGNHNATPEEYFCIVEMKAAVAKATMQIGATLGEGNEKQIDTLGNYGKILSILMKIRDDFIDMYEPDELENRFKNECLPIPILYAFKNLKTKNRILSTLEKKSLAEKDAFRIVKLVIESPEFYTLKTKVTDLSKIGFASIKRNGSIASRQLELLLRAATEDW